MARFNPWLRIAFDTWSLSLDAAAVITLRASKLAVGGPAAEAEAHQMISEKIAAAGALQMLALSGGLGWSAPTVVTRTIAHYRRKVRANQKRLSKT